MEYGGVPMDSWLYWTLVIGGILTIVGMILWENKFGNGTRRKK